MSKQVVVWCGLVSKDIQSQSHYEIDCQNAFGTKVTRGYLTNEEEDAGRELVKFAQKPQLMGMETTLRDTKFLRKNRKVTERRLAQLLIQK